MDSRPVEIERKTKETSIRLSLDMDNPSQEIHTGVPFFDHILTGMAFHGQFGLKIEASGDLEVDAHHLVEDVGISLGKALRKTVEQYGHIRRFGQAIIPMDEALSETVIDVSGRAYLVYTAEFPQEYCGDFPVALIKEFLYALAQYGGITLHASCRYGENSHHMAESLLKALGRALHQAYQAGTSGNAASTKGMLE